MRLLWVTAEPPDRAGGGGAIRQAALLGALARVHDVDLLLAGELRDPQVREAVRTVRAVPVRPPGAPRSTAARRARDVRLALRDGPAEHFAGRTARAALAPLLDEELARGAHDVVVVQHAALAALRRRSRAHWVCELHNVASGTADALAGLAPGARQRLLFAREAGQCRALERRVLAAYDRVVAVSDDDAALLPGPVLVVPNGVDAASFPVAPLPAAPRVVFTGTLSYLPNVDGLGWFAREVWPRVRAAVPGATLEVVGREPVAEVRSLADQPGVALAVDVPDVRPHLAAARVAVVPLRLGTGSRLKALEAMAAGRPVVGTTTGLAGLDVAGAAVVADDPAALAAGVVRLLTDDAEAQRLGAAGRARARQADWAAIGAAYATALGELS